MRHVTSNTSSLHSPAHGQKLCVKCCSSCNTSSSAQHTGPRRKKIKLSARIHSEENSFNRVNRRPHFPSPLVFKLVLISKKAALFFSLTTALSDMSNQYVSLDSPVKMNMERDLSFPKKPIFWTQDQNTVQDILLTDVPQTMERCKASLFSFCSKQWYQRIPPTERSILPFRSFNGVLIRRLQHNSLEPLLCSAPCIPTHCVEASRNLQTHISTACQDSLLNGLGPEQHS